MSILLGIPSIIYKTRAGLSYLERYINQITLEDDRLFTGIKTKRDYRLYMYDMYDVQVNH